MDAAVEASGLPATLLQALEATAPRGQVLILGDLKGDVTIPRALVSSLIRRELTVLGTWNSKIAPGRAQRMGHGGRAHRRRAGCRSRR